MSEYFYLKHNVKTAETNNNFTLINSSIPYKYYITKSDNTTQFSGGYKYRPALRMQFKPILYNSEKTTYTSIPRFYPNNITIMKRQDYTDNIWNTNIELVLQKTENNGVSWTEITPSDLSYYSDSSYTYDNIKQLIFNKNLNIDISSYNSNKLAYEYQNNLNKKGIVFHQYVGYQRLVFYLNYIKPQNTNQIIQNLNVYYQNLTTPLYHSETILTENQQENLFDNFIDNNHTAFKQELRYCNLTGQNDYLSNPIFATSYRNIDFYKALGIVKNNLFDQNVVNKANVKFRFIIKFKNFILAKLSERDIKIENSEISEINGIYNITDTKTNGEYVYKHSTNEYYLQYVGLSETNQYYWIVSSQIKSEILTSFDNHIYYYSQSNPQNLYNIEWYYNNQLFSDVSESSSTLTNEYINSSVVNSNAIQINYSKNYQDGYVNVGSKDSNLKFFRGIENGRWLYNPYLQKEAVFTRLTNSNPTNYINSIPYVTDSNSYYETGQYYSPTNNIHSFVINTPVGNLQDYVLYLDYLMKKENNTYSINGIQDYLNTPILLMVSFQIWNNVGTDLQHDTSVHFNQVFGFIQDYCKSSNKPLQLLYNDSTIPFLINNQENYVDATAQNSQYLRNNGFPTYINYFDKFFANIKEGELSVNSIYDKKFFRITKYRYSESPFEIDDSDVTVKWIDLYNIPNTSVLSQPDFYNTQTTQNANIQLIFANEQESAKQIFLQVADNEMNVSNIVMATMTVYTTSPGSLFIKITGTNGGSNYTGVDINSKNQQFSIDNEVSVQFSASSAIKLYYKITGGIYNDFLVKDQEGNLIAQKWSDYREFDANNNIVKLHLIPSSSYKIKSFTKLSDVAASQYNTLRKSRCTKLLVVDPDAAVKSEKQFDDENIEQKSQITTYNPQGVLDADNDVEIQITFRDEAGNISSITKTIYYNTRLFQSKNRNLRQANSTYDLQLYQSDPNGKNTLIVRTDTNIASTNRNWRDIFYPSSHGYPTLANGDIDQTYAKQITTATDEFDPVSINGNIVKDSQGRVTTVSWSKRKKYPAMVSSSGDINNSYSGFVYWIIDNTGYGDITLQFEHFYLDSIAYGPPYNQNLGQRPDALIVYDASDTGCVAEYIDSLGQTQYRLVDTTKLKMLQIYSGSGNGAMSLKTGRLGATSNGAFNTQAFATQRLCLIFYSDSRNSNESADSAIGSGFKIKAANQIVKYWQNFDIDQTNGLVWVHMSGKTESNNTYPAGRSIANAKMTYDYYNTKLKIDYDDGSVIFDQKPENVYATYTYYTYDKKDIPPVRTFMLDADDLVDYADLNLYFVPQGTTPTKVGSVDPIYKLGEWTKYDAGKINKYYYTDKDRGIIEFTNGVSLTQHQFGLVPRGRIYADYRYHTFPRLGNDGYSDFQFNDSMLIAGITSQYPDYTWGDIKIVNEGDTQLRDGKLTFLARGQVQNNAITSVLDYNRPWDVQQGTAQQTYNKVACAIRTSYIWDSYTCTRSDAISLFSSNGVNTFPGALQPKGVFYGRVVFCLGGSNNSYPATTAGRKSFSSEISGRFIQVD